jgi:hypothetical protein
MTVTPMRPPETPSPPRTPSRHWLAVGAVRTFPVLRRLVEQRDDLGRRVEQLHRQNARLRASNQRLRAQLDEARAAQVSDSAGVREDLRFLFIVTYGRSGSTLLQGIISSIPGYLIRGENGGVAYNLYKFHTTVSERVAAKRARWNSPRSAWFGIGGYPQERALREMRRLLLSTLLRPESDSRVVGYKEIRWLHDDLHGYVDFLRAVFPGARFVVNTRNLDDVVVSKWWARDPQSRHVLEDAESRMLRLVDRLGDDAFHVHYNDYVQSPDKLRGLFEWLGEEFDEAQVTEVMASRHSY